MNEEQALDRVDEIGQAFANDLNDGDSGVLYEGLHTVYDRAGNLNLVYSATLDSGDKISFTWRMDLAYTTEGGE